MKLVDDVIKSFECVKFFKESTDKITSINYDAPGEKLLTSSIDDSINVYDCVNGNHLQTVFSKKYGAELARFTHCSSAILHASNKYDDSIRYLSLHDNKYLRFFSGHTKKVVSLSMSPKNDCFLSASLDKTIRLWDLRTANCQAILNSQSKALATIDPEGLIFCAQVSNDSCKLYDLRTYHQGPFITFSFPQVYDGNQKSEIISIKFSPDGKMILLITNGSQLIIVDSYKGRIMHQIQIPGGNSNGVNLSGCFSADSRLVIATTPDSSVGRVAVWRLSSQVGNNGPARIYSYQLPPQIHGDAPAPISVVGANPFYAQIAMGQNSGHLSMWMPNYSEESDISNGTTSLVELTAKLTSSQPVADP